MVEAGFLLILALGMVAFGLSIIARAWRMTRTLNSAWYSIERRIRQSSVRKLGLQAGILFLLGGTILVWLLLNPPPRPVDLVSGQLLEKSTPMDTVSPTLSPTIFTVEPTLAATAVFIPTASPMMDDALPLVAIPTLDLGSQAIITNTGGGGLWLRDTPFGNGLLLLAERSVVYVRGGLLEVDNLNWQRVADADGREGWVAADYLVYR